ncbi:1-phosphatidylinositol phosphodiesterase [Nymphaea thermarum]|nr:1-phosphatidylinositol phosphodiesterase [Nymphaea thermarum]
MGSHVSKQMERRKSVGSEKQQLHQLHEERGVTFPGSDHRPADRKTWMSSLDLQRLQIKSIVWPGTHDSGTNKVGIRFVSRPFAQCQSCSIYRQLVLGARVLDIRVDENRRVCHGILATYSVDVVIRDVKRFLSETQSELILLEIRTEFGKNDPPDFDKYLVDQLGDVLIHQDEGVFDRTVAEVLPRRVICVWKPSKAAPPGPGSPLWSRGYLRDNWIDTDLPMTKFQSNLKHLGEQQPVSGRKYFYRVENTATPQADNPVVCVRPVTGRIHGFARLFIAEAFNKGIGDRIQVFSTDFIDGDFVDACVGLTQARLEGKA